MSDHKSTFGIKESLADSGLVALSAQEVAEVHGRLKTEPRLLNEVSRIIGQVAAGMDHIPAAYIDRDINVTFTKDYEAHESARMAKMALSRVVRAESSEWTGEPTPVTVRLAMDQVDQLAAQEQPNNG